MDHEFIAEWFRFADTDLLSAEHLQSLYPQPLEIICYHCQQSVEKSLKGYLINKGAMEPPKTHNLNTLIDMCLEYDEHFDKIKRICDTLNRYGVQPRYPNEIEILEQDMLKALEYARQIWDFEALMEVRQKTSL